MHNRYHLMRHGESLANEADRIVSHPDQGCIGFGLSELGRRQAHEWAAASGLGPDTRILCSDFLRTRETAEIVAAALGCPPPHPEPRLRERFFGAWDGTSAANYQVAWDRDERDQEGDGVESPAALLARLGQVVDELEEQERGQCFLLVSHGDPLRFLQLWAVGRPSREHQSIRHFAPSEIRALHDAPTP